MTDQSTPATDTGTSSPTNKPTTISKAQGARKWLLRLALMTVVPALLLVALEFGLRVLGYGYPTTFFVRNTFSGRPVYTDNPDFGLRFFPRSLLRFAGPRVFPAHKAPGTYRIFILGESAAEGVPASAYSFSRILEVLLQERFPNRKFEVINTGTTAINSHVIVPIAREIAYYQPNLVVVYMGNNEVIGPYGPATVLSSYSPNLGLIRTTVFARSTKIGQLLNNTITALVPDEKAPQGWGGMAMFLQHRLRADDPRLAVVYNHFQQNLHDICRSAIAADARVLISTVGVNLKDSAPFASLHRQGLNTTDLTRWNKLYAAGIAAETSRDYPVAIRHFEAAAKIDDQFADLRFRLGRCYQAISEYSGARKEYQQARDLDVVRFRTNSNLNNIIRETPNAPEFKASNLVELADTEKSFAQHSPHGIPGANLFYEHVHMNFNGNYLLALGVLQKIEKYVAGASSSSTTVPNSADVKTPLSVEECARRLAFTPWDRQIIARTIMSGAQTPPFTNQLDHRERMALMQRQVQALESRLQTGGMEQSAAQYRQAIQLRNDDWMLHKGFADLLLQQGNAGEAVQHLEIMQRQLPHSPWAARLLQEAMFRRMPGRARP